nr:NADH dehydrogenase subunit 2 [Parabathippus shelfordi]
MFIPSIYCFVFIYLLSFVLVMGSDDWFLVWMGLEINMMSFLILIYRRSDLSIIESCLKYFFIQSIGSALLIGLFYLNESLLGNMFFVILSYKVGAGPFFFWFPSLCSGMMWVSCYVLMTFQSILPLLLMQMFVHWVLWLIVVLSLIVGILGSFNQCNMKQLMAYSSIHHLGWIMLVMMIDVGWFMYMLIYMLVLYSVVGFLVKEEVVDLSMMYYNKFKMFFVIGMLSMGGIPPLLGFYLKWMALVNILSNNMIYVMMLMLVSVVMLYVYMRIVYDILFSEVGSIVVEMNFMLSDYNVEMLSVMGIIVGVVGGIFMMI